MESNRDDAFKKDTTPMDAAAVVLAKARHGLTPDKKSLPPKGGATKREATYHTTLTER